MREIISRKSWPGCVQVAKDLCRFAPLLLCDPGQATHPVSPSAFFSENTFKPPCLTKQSLSVCLSRSYYVAQDGLRSILSSKLGVMGKCHFPSKGTKEVGLPGAERSSSCKDSSPPGNDCRGQVPVCLWDLWSNLGPATFSTFRLHSLLLPPLPSPRTGVFSLDDICRLLIVVTFAYICIRYGNQAIYF